MMCLQPRLRTDGERAVAQELIAHGFNLYYFNSKKRGEIDVIVESKDGEVAPIEVKSGKDYKRHNAINNIFDVKEYRLSNGYVLAPCNVKREGRLLYLPVNMVSLLQND